MDADRALVDRLRETEQQIAVLHAEQLELIAELYERAAGWITAPADTPGLVDAAEVTAAEIGVALRISRRQAMDGSGWRCSCWARCPTPPRRCAAAS